MLTLPLCVSLDCADDSTGAARRVILFIQCLVESLATEYFLWVGILTLRETQEHVFGLESVAGALSEVFASWVSVLSKLFLCRSGFDRPECCD